MPTSQAYGSTLGALLVAGSFLGGVTALAAPVTGTVVVSTAGHEMYYEVEGSGEPLVLIHGLTLDMRMWDAQVAAFADEYQVIRFDALGHGKSSGLAGSPPSPNRQWDHLLTLLDALQIDKAHIAGLSMGGAIAVNFALQHPERIHTLTSIDGVVDGVDVSGTPLSARFGNYLNISRTQGVQAALAQWITDPIFAPAMANESVRAQLEEIVLQGHGGLGNGAMFQMPNLGKVATLNSAGSRLREIDVPTLVMVGELDAPDFHTRANALDRGVPDSTKVVVPNAGHMSNMEQPEFVNDVLLSFLRSHPLPRAGDANGDGQVDLRDFGILKAHFGTGSTRAEGDFDGNGRVDLSDFGILKNNLSGTGTAAVPEPGTLALLFLGACGQAMGAAATLRWR